MNDVVLVDSNLIVKRDWRLTSPWWSVLRGLAATGQISLIVPEIVIREVVGRFSESITTPSREMNKLGVSIDASAEVELYEAELRRALSGSGISCPSHDPTTILELSDRAIRRVRPFNDQGGRKG